MGVKYSPHDQQQRHSDPSGNRRTPESLGGIWRPWNTPRKRKWVLKPLRARGLKTLHLHRERENTLSFTSPHDSLAVSPQKSWWGRIKSQPMAARSPFLLYTEFHLLKTWILKPLHKVIWPEKIKKNKRKYCHPIKSCSCMDYFPPGQHFTAKGDF